MPAKSKSQQAVAGMALAMKEGKMPHDKSMQAHEMMKSMGKEELKKMAHTDTKSLPKHVKAKKKVMTSDGYMMK